MVKFIAAFATLLFLTTALSAQDKRERVDSLMNYYASEYNFNGVALVAGKGNMVLEKAYGYRVIDKKVPHDINSIFPVGNITTQLTAEVVFQLAAEHKLGLDDKLSKYYPKFPKGDSITIRHLLTNTSGILDYFMFDGFFLKHDSLHVSKDTLMSLFDKRSMPGVPGTRLQYSNSNYLMLGYIIEQITHKSYAEVIRERILIPAGMTHSGFDYRGLKDSHKSQGYRHYTDHEKPVVLVDSTLSGAAASLYSTASDLYAFHKALQEYKFVNKKTQDSMYLPFQRNYGYGCFVDTILGKIVIIDGGQIQGFSCYLMRIPADDLCIVLMQNIYSPAFDNYSICHKIVEALYNKDFNMPRPIPIITLPAAQLQSYVGQYEFPSGVTMDITVDGDNLLVHNIPPRGEQGHAIDFDIEPIATNKFKTKSLNATLEFMTDASGNVQQLVLHSPKHDINAKKKVPKN
jgi:CubicO group peptidase (beta-lactamase class C family)